MKFIQSFFPLNNSAGIIIPVLWPTHTNRRTYFVWVKTSLWIQSRLHSKKHTNTPECRETWSIYERETVWLPGKQCDSVLAKRFIRRCKNAKVEPHISQNPHHMMDKKCPGTCFALSVCLLFPLNYQFAICKRHIVPECSWALYELRITRKTNVRCCWGGMKLSREDDMFPVGVFEIQF